MPGDGWELGFGAGYAALGWAESSHQTRRVSSDQRGAQFRIGRRVVRISRRVERDVVERDVPQERFEMWTYLNRVVGHTSGCTGGQT